MVQESSCFWGLVGDKFTTWYTGMKAKWIKQSDYTRTERKPVNFAAGTH